MNDITALPLGSLLQVSYGKSSGKKKTSSISKLRMKGFNK